MSNDAVPLDTANNIIRRFAYLRGCSQCRSNLSSGRLQPCKACSKSPGSEAILALRTLLSPPTEDSLHRLCKLLTILFSSLSTIQLKSSDFASNLHSHNEVLEPSASSFNPVTDELWVSLLCVVVPAIRHILYLSCSTEHPQLTFPDAKLQNACLALLIIPVARFDSLWSSTASLVGTEFVEDTAPSVKLLLDRNFEPLKYLNWELLCRVKAKFGLLRDRDEEPQNRDEDPVVKTDHPINCNRTLERKETEDQSGPFEPLADYTSGDPIKRVKLEDF